MFNSSSNMLIWAYQLTFILYYIKLHYFILHFEWLLYQCVIL